ncbi:hypothetical protein ACFW04_014500 [Cataglyphis niger]
MLFPLLVLLPLSHIFQERFASCFIDNNFTHVQSNNILSLLQSHSCFHNLPKDVRTLLNTPRVKTIVSNVEPGKYIHFDLEANIIEVLSCFPIDSLPNQINIDFNTDGCNLNRLASIKHIKPIIVEVYKGSAKPYNLNLFFKKFIANIKKILASGGIIFKKKKSIRLRCFITDAPTRTFILNHTSHLSCHPCSKCIVCGIRCERRYIFSDEEHHKEDTSPLSLLLIRKMVSQVPFEYAFDLSWSNEKIVICLGSSLCPIRPVSNCNHICPIEPVSDQVYVRSENFIVFDP